VFGVVPTVPKVPTLNVPADVTDIVLPVHAVSWTEMVSFERDPNPVPP
jgi:hypothetical protein